MLTATFSCFRGLGEGAERRLWQRGCLTWDALERIQRPVLSAGKLNSVREQLAEARAALRGRLADWFLNRLPPVGAIRVLPHCRDAVAFVDIETTGLTADDTVTTVALYDGNAIRVFVNGIDLGEFLAHLAHVRLIVTYNGGRFDLPRLRAHFGIDLTIPHLDLMRVAGACGLKGGLKACEKAVGFVRPEDDAGDGAEAVRLWRRWQTGDRGALRRLIHYNAHDVLSLESLAVHLYNLSMRPYPLTVTMPASPHVEISRILNASAL